MKIQQINNNFINFNIIRLKDSSLKTNFFENQVLNSKNEIETITNEYQATTSTRVDSYVLPPIISNDEMIYKPTLEELKESENAKKEFNMDVEKISNILNKLGLNGELTGIIKETVPQNYSVYYIESLNENTKNIVIIELENGELMVKETLEDKDTLFENFNYFRSKNGFDIMKFDIDKLKNLFDEFIDSFEKNKLNLSYKK